MPAKKPTTNWKRLLQDSTGGTDLLAAGTRSSTGNDGKFNNLQNLPDDKSRMDAVLQMMEANRKLRDAAMKNSYHPRLKGLFGGG